RTFRARNPGGATGGCLYIGVTGLTPEERFERHRAGTQSGRFVQTHGIRLPLDLVEGFSRLPYRIAAAMEPKLAAWLRAQGFAVWQNCIIAAAVRGDPRCRRGESARKPRPWRRRPWRRWQIPAAMRRPRRGRARL